MGTKKYSIAGLKAGLSSILADVSRGAEVVVTDHNRPVARLVSVRRLPALPKADIEGILAHRPLPLKAGALPSAALVRRLRDEG